MGNGLLIANHNSARNQISLEEIMDILKLIKSKIDKFGGVYLGAEDVLKVIEELEKTNLGPDVDPTERALVYGENGELA